MRNITVLAVLFCFIISIDSSVAQVKITVDMNQPAVPYSRYIFGKNNTFNSLAGNSGTPTFSEWLRIKDSGITVFRENGGNNSTKYNWKAKLSSHPDWYNNVYPNNWDHLASLIADSLPDRKAVFGFQLIGKAAASKDHNFNDWAYNNSQWWSGTRQNLAGGGVLNPAGGEKALSDGNPDLYLKPWPADSTTGILDHWFNNLGFDKDQFQYWCMDNEPEIWEGTHDDVVGPEQTAEQFMQLYFAVAKKARATYPNIKLLGPIAATEWQWYNWHNQRVSYKGKSYCWLEYFILRISEEQQASGIRLLDVLTLHHYPSSDDIEKVMQYHRVFYDTDYVYPEANGVRAVNGGWDNSITKEYIFKRAEDWLNQYLGSGHGVTLGNTETGVQISDPDAVAVWYASTLGEFMKHNVELFTPWEWKPVMWEVVHMFANYSQAMYQPAVSDNDNLVSAYVTTDASGDKVTAILVNRYTSSKPKVNLVFQGKYPVASSIQALQLDKVPAAETFFSHEQNALKSKEFIAGNTSITVSMEPLSLVVLTFETTTDIPTGLLEETGLNRMAVYPNPASGAHHVEIIVPDVEFKRLVVSDVQGRELQSLSRESFNSQPEGQNSASINTAAFRPGVYLLRLEGPGKNIPQKLIIQ